MTRMSPSHLPCAPRTGLAPYAPDAFACLRDAALRLHVPGLAHQPFVDHYYTGNPWCHLCVVRDADGAITGTIGVDRMNFAAGERSLTIGFASNYHAAQSGLGGYLYLHWMKSVPLGLVFGGSEDTHRILRRQRWTYFSGVQTFALNAVLRPLAGEPAWRRWAQRAASAWREAPPASRIPRIPADLRQRVSVVEEHAFDEEMLPETSPFTFRFAPSLDYLSWRYAPGLPFVRYRLFRICTSGQTSGYVVLNDRPDRVMVAHCDGMDARELACGVLLSIAQVTALDAGCREVVLASSHGQMQEIYRRFGFRSWGERPFAVGSRQGPVDLPAGTAQWLVNLDWGDNGLRAPFLDQLEGMQQGAGRNAGCKT